MSRNMDKKVKQKQAGRWDEYVQKTKQDKKNAEFVASCVFAFRCGKPAIGLPAASKKQIEMKK